MKISLLTEIIEDEGEPILNFDSPSCLILTGVIDEKTKYKEEILLISNIILYLVSLF